MDTPNSNVRIARPIRTPEGALIKTEVFGNWIVSPSEVPDSAKFKLILRYLSEAQTEEPSMGWKLEARGTEAGWHEWKAA